VVKTWGTLIAIKQPNHLSLSYYSHSLLERPASFFTDLCTVLSTLLALRECRLDLMCNALGDNARGTTSGGVPYPGNENSRWPYHFLAPCLPEFVSPLLHGGTTTRTLLSIWYTIPRGCAGCKVFYLLVNWTKA
jgi:hypothetical protein